LSRIYTAIEFGTTKLTVLISRRRKSGSLEILGLGNVSYSGIQGENWKHADSIRSVLLKAVEQAQDSAGLKVRHCVIGIPNEFCGLIRNYRELALEREVSRQDVEDLRQTIEDYPLPDPWEVSDVYYGYFNADGQAITGPIGMHAGILGVEASLICMHGKFVSQLTKYLEELNIAVDGVVSIPVAYSRALLTPEETDSGALIIDVGGHSTDIAYFKDGRPLIFDWLPLGGKHISQDVEKGMSIPFSEAERLKKKCSLADDGKTQADGARSMTETDQATDEEAGRTAFLKQIVEARVEEILTLSVKKAAASGLIDRDCSIVLTGGGLAMYKGIREFSTEVLDMPVRLGVPDVVGLASPVLASVYSLALADPSRGFRRFYIRDYIDSMLLDIKRRF